ncbi:MAG: hypothetical protein OXN94_06210 [Chloroflexota bacterium]|nr:hypothetical protein [Chloroflexota bacterium]
MPNDTSYREFTKRLKLLISKHPNLITTTLSNIFTMRLIGNKTHGDLAEIAIPEFINQYMYDFTSTHVGKGRFRAKEHEEDISVVNQITEEEMLISIKAYGVGPLQLSTDKEARMFPFLESQGEFIINDYSHIREILESPAFSEIEQMNVLPLIYDEKKSRCNILVFDSERAKQSVATISKVTGGRGRKHPIYVFQNENDEYICEVRYGGAAANALQRGLWTHTRNAIPYFDSVTSGWIDYSHNLILVKLFSHALVASKRGHIEALERVKRDIEAIIQGEGL